MCVSIVTCECARSTVVAQLDGVHCSIEWPGAAWISDSSETPVAFNPVNSHKLKPFYRSKLYSTGRPNWLESESDNEPLKSATKSEVKPITSEDWLL